MVPKVVLVFVQLLLAFVVYSENRINYRKVLVTPGDLHIGALLSIHGPPSQETGYSDECGDIQEGTGIASIEMLLAAMDLVNAVPQVLPGIKLGAVVRDSCGYAPTTMENTILFAQDYIYSIQDSFEKFDNCTGKETVNPAVVGIVGLTNDKLTRKVNNVLETFNIPQIGLSSRENQPTDPYLVRVIPPGNNHAKAIVDIVQRYNWTYISLVQHQDVQHFRLAAAFQNLIKESRICIATSLMVSDTNDDESGYDMMVLRLLQKSNSKVVVCMCDQNTLYGLLQAMKRKNVEKKFFVIATAELQKTYGPKTVQSGASSGLSVTPDNQSPNFFRDTFLSLRPDTNRRNVWFEEYWQEKFNCSLDESNSTYIQQCLGDEKIEAFDESMLTPVFNSIYAIATTLHNMHRDLCGGRSGMCPGLGQGEQLIGYLKNVSVTTLEGNTLFFDKNGDGPERYSIINFHNGTSEKVGSWTNGDLVLEDDAIWWTGNKESVSVNGTVSQSEVPDSVCSYPCADSEVKSTQFGMSCCWICVSCPKGEYPVNETTCSNGKTSISGSLD